jgi:hypothetical protein
MLTPASQVKAITKISPTANAPGKDFVVAERFFVRGFLTWSNGCTQVWEGLICFDC